MYKITEKVKLARKYKREIAKLKKEQEKIYHKALRILRLSDSSAAWDYFMNDPVGFSGVEQELTNE